MNTNYWVGGKIGNVEIAKEDINTFMAGMKDFEWTDNNLYKSAKVVEVKPTFVNDSGKGGNYTPKNVNFDLFYVDENPHLADFENYKSKIENERVNVQDKINSKNQEFVSKFFENQSVQSKQDLLQLIKSKKQIIISNSNLKDKLGKYVGYLTSEK